MIKPIPPPSLDHVLPPNLDHEYFKDGGRHPFRPRASSFELVNAWWLAETALLSYASDEFARAKFRDADFSIDDDQPFLGASTLCYVARSPEAAIVVFRGTQVVKPGETPTLGALREVLADFLTDGRFRLIDLSSSGGGGVHQGFQEALDQIWSAKLLPCLTRLRAQNPNLTIWFTGHSLGAALATLAAQRFRDVQGVYTFGSPLVGDGPFARNYPAKAFRIVNNNDIVARVPPAGASVSNPFNVRPYEHVGRLMYLGKDGALNDNPSDVSVTFDRLRGRLAHVLDLTSRLRPGWLNEVPDDSLNDHAPLYYALHMWNAYAVKAGDTG